MATERDLEKGPVPDNGTMTTESTAYHSDHEKADAEFKIAEGATGEPDLEHEQVESMDAGHMTDLAMSRTIESIKAGKKNVGDDSEVRRVETKNSLRSTKSRMSRIATALTNRSKKERLPPQVLPLMDLDRGIVGWESQDDPEMPLNFQESRKWMLIGLLASITFISPLASSMFAPGVIFMDIDFHNTSTILTSLTVSIFILGYAVGPLLLAPLSEIYGRRLILTCANAFFCVWQIGCALAPNLASLIVFRFLAGIGGSGCITIGGGVIADIFAPDRRGVASSIYSIGPLFGPVIGPICGGFIAQRIGWRWVFWILLIVGTLLTIGIELLNRETNPKVLIHRKVQRLQKELNRTDLISCYDEGQPIHSPTHILINGMVRPLKMLFRSPIMFLLSLYMAVVYGLLYLLFTTITAVFIKQYHWQPELTGLAYIGIGIGFLTGVSLVAKISDPTIIRMTKANNGVFEPEMRLSTCLFFACFIPISFFWYGWAAEKAVHWIVPIIGLIPFGFGMMGIFIPIQTYTIDSFPAYAASAIAALTVSRSLLGAFLPLAGPYMYDSLGYGWGNSVLGFIAIGLIPCPALIYKFGGKIRKEHPIKL
ncbi:MFS general substrate transporter [Venustampulla echinocandica]|uniref:MFS general substrate transporter n=1 Tax=Venustampulla echinocandica TaxID=2656787 RepID=A0A370TFJ2_9HELO|nr:MFS general substrate transporter [Venustampulla echinocandica]RDL33668.1 MFS general substrate transporter [Venustampulla echinocandica]